MKHRPVYLCDIDGTVADCTHRLHHISDGKHDWKAFFRDCVYDIPIPEVIKTINMLEEAGAMIIMVSGRSDEVREQTERWLICNNVHYWASYMRKAGDYRADNIVKAELLEQVLKDRGILMSDIVGVFEDRQQVVDMYREKGLRVFQVAKGDF